MQQQSSELKSSNHNSELCQKLLSFSQDGKFSDICIISSDEVRLDAHKCVLAALSDYFLAMFDGSLKESTAAEVKINDLNGVVLKQILTFLYTGRIELSNQTIQDILRAANYLQIRSLICECYIFLGSSMDAKNCLSIALFADQHGLIDLSEKTSMYASTHFDDLSKCKEFLDLNENQISSIISREDLCVSSEEKVFLSLVQWMENDMPNRDKSALILFSKVRYWLLSVEFIKQQRTKLPKQIEYLQMICTWLEWHSAPESSRPRKPMKFLQPEKKPQRLQLYSYDLKQTYDPTSNVWISEEIKLPLHGYESFIINDTAIIKGSRKVWRFDFHTETKREMYLTRERTKFGSAVLNSEFFAVGGYKDNEPAYRRNWSRTVEKYNFFTGKWQDITPMEIRYIHPKAAVSNGLLYVVGDECSTMSCFNPATSQWTSQPFLEHKRSSFGFTAVGSVFYVVGGVVEENNKCEVTNTVAAFDTRLGKWVPSKQMNIPRKYPKCTSLNNKLMTFGGKDETEDSLNLVQEYNPSTKEWKTLAPIDGYNENRNYSFTVID